MNIDTMHGTKLDVLYIICTAVYWLLKMDNKQNMNIAILGTINLVY